MELNLIPSTADLIGFADSDWGGDLSTRKSTSGYACFYRDCLISWKSKKQRVVSISSMEGEIYALVDVIQEILFLNKLLQEQNGKTTLGPIEIMEDKLQDAIAFLNNNSTHGRSKHIDIRVFFVRDLVKTNVICKICTHRKNNVADVFTKPLGRIKFLEMCDKLHLSNRVDKDSSSRGSVVVN